MSTTSLPNQDTKDTQPPLKEVTQDTLSQVSSMLGDEQLQKFLTFIREKSEIQKILSEMKNKLSPEFSDKIKKQLSLEGENKEIDELVDSLMILFSFVLFSSTNKLQAREVLNEFTGGNPDISLRILDPLLVLVNEGVSPFIMYLEYFIKQIKTQNFREILDLGTYVINSALEKLSIPNDKLVGIIDTYLQIFANIILFNPITGPILRAIGVGVSSFVAINKFSERNKEELEESIRYLTEMTPSSVERTNELLKEAKTMGHRDRIVLGITEIKRSLLAARIGVETKDIRREGD